jgi:hypothetical protein
MDAIRDNNFTPKQIRGIDLVVKSMAKKYPYVKGWKFDEEYDRWSTTLYIDIFVNWKEYGEVNGYRFRDYYEKNYYSKSPQKNPKGPSQGSEFIIRGGSFLDKNDHRYRSTYRSISINKRYYNIGFRLAHGSF